MKNLVNLLKKLDLSEREVGVYLYCLENRPASIADLAKFLKKERMIVYRVVDKLVEMGILEKENKEFGPKVLAAPPQRLLEIIKKEQRKWKKIELQLEGELPRLKGMQKSQADLKPRIHFFEGLDGVKKACSLFLEGKQGDRVILFANNEVVQKEWPEFDEEIRQMRVQAGVKALMIHPNTKLGKKLALRDKEHLRQIKVLPVGINYDSTMGVLDDRVLLMGFKPPQAVVLKNEELAKTIRIALNLLWQKL